MSFLVFNTYVELLNGVSLAGTLVVGLVLSLVMVEGSGGQVREERR